VPQVSAVPELRRPPIASAALGLGLISRGLNRDLLRELAAGPQTRPAVTARLHAGQTRVYERLRELRAARLVEAEAVGRAPLYRLTASGRALLSLAAAVESWFALHPSGALESSVGWRAFADVGEAWRSGLIEWIVRLAPSDLDVARGLPGYEGRRLAEVLAAMGEAGMVDRRRRADGSAHYRAAPWTARAIGPLAALARWEERFDPPGGASIAVEDAVVAILASLPLVRLGEEALGIYTLTVEAGRGAAGARRTGTVWVRLRHGRAVAVGEGRPPRPADGWTGGSFEAWLAAVLDGSGRAVRPAGRDAAAIETVAAVVDQLHVQLTGPGP
jgi:DNA-binding HxlR family transcriptional regulator